MSTLKRYWTVAAILAIGVGMSLIVNQYPSLEGLILGSTFAFMLSEWFANRYPDKRIADMLPKDLEKRRRLVKVSGLLSTTVTLFTAIWVFSTIQDKESSHFLEMLICGFLFTVGMYVELFCLIIALMRGGLSKEIEE